MKGNPLPFASILVRSSSVGTTANNEENIFSISMPENTPSLFNMWDTNARKKY
jgi:hypothetical protein